jgi:hypothetical protein
MTETPGEIWRTDMTFTVTTDERQVCFCVAVDHCGAEGLGVKTSLSGDRFEEASNG